MYLNLEIFVISLDTSVTCLTDQDDFNLTFNLIRDDTKKTRANHIQRVVGIDFDK